jgi:hypothetical protein
MLLFGDGNFPTCILDQISRFSNKFFPYTGEGMFCISQLFFFWINRLNIQILWCHLFSLVSIFLDWRKTRCWEPFYFGGMRLSTYLFIHGQLQIVKHIIKSYIFIDKIFKFYFKNLFDFNFNFFMANVVHLV